MKMTCEDYKLVGTDEDDRTSWCSPEAELYIICYGSNRVSLAEGIYQYIWYISVLSSRHIIIYDRSV